MPLAEEGVRGKDGESSPAQHTVAWSANSAPIRGGSISACFCERDLDTTISSTKPAVSILVYPVRELRPASVFVCVS
jgi:hypothetical protein